MKALIQVKRLANLPRSLVLGLSLVAAGLVIGGLSLFIAWHAQHSAAQPVSQLLDDNSASRRGNLIEGTPVRVQVPSVGIDLKVIPGYYYRASNSWSLSLNNAQWGVMTAKANNQAGATFIYAHYRLSVFYTLPHVQSSAEAIITTDNGHSFHYKFRASQITTPNDTRLFNYQGKPLLIMQTCTGLWYQNRQLFAFDFEKVT